MTSLHSARTRLFGFGPIRFTAMRRADLKPLVLRWAGDPGSTLSMTLTGAHGVTESLNDPAVRRAHEDADFVLCDGTPPFLGALLHGHGARVDRIPGRDAMREIAAAAASLSVRQAFIGGPPGVAERAWRGLESAIGAPIDGFAWSPPFVDRVNDAFADEVAARLRALSTPAVVWLGLSTPKQELLAQALKQRLPDGFFLVAVGAAFDMYAGTSTPAPAFISRLGLEWLYRSLQEPRRLPARYARALPVVLAALAAAAWTRVRRGRR